MLRRIIVLFMIVFNLSYLLADKKKSFPISCDSGSECKRDDVEPKPVGCIQIKDFKKKYCIGKDENGKVVNVFYKK